MRVHCLGLNYKHAPVEIRERLAVGEKKSGETSAETAKVDEIEEAVVLSTCNRTEFYVASHEGESFPQAIENHVRRHFQLGDDPLPFYHHSDAEAVRHLFHVASGMDSMVLGETEIFGQVKAAYAAALEAGATSSTLNQLFQKTFNVGKHVRTHSKITSGPTSVGAVAVELAVKIFGDLKRCKVLLIGAGEISRSTAKSLATRGARGIVVSNRSFDKAEELAGEMEGRAIRFDDFQSELPSADIVIGSTAAPHTIIDGSHVDPVLRKRRGRPLFFIDIAVPRDIDPGVGDRSGVYLYDIDGLESIATESRKKRASELARCERLVEELMQKHGVLSHRTNAPQREGTGLSSPEPPPAAT
ncbi:MAG: glutamyl-tRNA reductase [Verrucomicrobiota bacterium]